MKFVCYADGGTPAKWYWRMLLNNGKVIAVSSVGHVSKLECLRSIHLIKSNSYSAVIEDEHRNCTVGKI